MVRLVLTSAIVGMMSLTGLPWIASSAPGRGGGAPGVSSASILGAVWDEANVAVGSARVRLRDYATGRLVTATRADEHGRFAFRNLEGGHYVVEIVSDTGKVLALGVPLSVAAGETVATFVRLGARLPWFSGFFQNAAAAAVSTASSLGVTAVAPAADSPKPAACPQ